MNEAVGIKLPSRCRLVNLEIEKTVRERAKQELADGVHTAWRALRAGLGGQVCTAVAIETGSRTMANRVAPHGLMLITLLSAIASRTIGLDPFFASASC